MVLENILSLYQGTNERAVIPVGIFPRFTDSLLDSWDCDCSGWDCDCDCSGPDFVSELER